MCVYPCSITLCCICALHYYYVVVCDVSVYYNTVGVGVLASAQTCTGFVIVVWVFQYYTQTVSRIIGVSRG